MGDRDSSGDRNKGIEIERNGGKEERGTVSSRGRRPSPSLAGPNGEKKKKISPLTLELPCRYDVTMQGSEGIDLRSA